MRDNRDHDERDDVAGGTHPPDRRPAPNGHLEPELLSAYLDDPMDLAPDVLRRVDEHLPSCEICQRTLAELRLVVQLLGSLPLHTPPSTYHLTREMVQPSAREPIVLQQTPAWYVRHVSLMQGVAAFAAVLFVFVLAADILTRSSGEDNSNLSAPAIERAAESSIVTPEDETSAAEPAEGTLESGAPPPLMTAPAEDDTESADAQATSAPLESMQAESAAEQPEPTAQVAADERATDGDALTETLQSNRGEEAGGSSRFYWRVAEFGLVVIAIGLLSVGILLPRMERSRSH